VLEEQDSSQLGSSRAERIMQLEKIYEHQLIRMNDVVASYEEDKVTLSTCAMNAELYAFEQFLEASRNDPNTATCSYTQCKERALSGSVFCLGHVLNDRKQKLFIPCVVCEAPVAKVLHSSLCTDHKPTPAILQKRERKIN
jgi:hypothetical protein